MKILFVSARPLSINTSSSIRNRAYINGLVELGYDVEVLSIGIDNNHEKYEILNSPFNDKVKNIWLSAGNFGRIKSFKRKSKFIKYFKNLAYNLYSTFSIFDTPPKVIKKVLDLNINLNDYNFIISSSDPKSSHELVSYLIKNKAENITWIQIWGDPFYSDITRKSKVLNKKIKIKEHELLSKADKVVYVSHLTRQDQARLFPDYAYKMFYIPTPYIEAKVFSKNEKTEKLKFLYLGDYYSKVRDLYPLYSVFSERENISLEISGDTDLKLDSKKNISIKSRVNYSMSEGLIRDCDILIHLSNLKGNQIPGKIFHYSATNKPILFILDGNHNEIKEEFTRYNRYIFCNNTVDSIKQGIEYIEGKFIDMNYEPVKEFSATSCVEALVKL